MKILEHEEQFRTFTGYAGKSVLVIPNGDTVAVQVQKGNDVDTWITVGTPYEGNELIQVGANTNVLMRLSFSGTAAEAFITE